MIVINDKAYPILSQVIEKKGEFIGGMLVDNGDEFSEGTLRTNIIDIVLKENGKDSAWFEVSGKDFACGFDTEHGGIAADGTDAMWLAFRGPGGHSFKICRSAAWIERQADVHPGEIQHAG